MAEDSERIFGQPGGATPDISGAGEDRRWQVSPWRLIPPLLVLLTVLFIVLTNLNQLQANHWAYPALLAIAGLISGIMVIRARPRRGVQSSEPQARKSVHATGHEWSTKDFH